MSFDRAYDALKRLFICVAPNFTSEEQRLALLEAEAVIREGPSQALTPLVGVSSFEGPSVRDQFAAAALTGLLSETGTRALMVAGQLSPSQLARNAYVTADAMMLERQKDPR